MQKITFEELIDRLETGCGELSYTIIRDALKNGWISLSQAHELGYRLLGKLEPSLRYLTKDKLTGLANEITFDRALEMAFAELRNEHQRENACSMIRVIALDMDGLKYLNDTYGHDLGDLAIQNLSSRILQAIRKDDIVARSHNAGDEFFVLLKGQSIPNIEAAYSRLLDGVAPHPIEFGFHGTETKEYISAGIGFVDADKESIQKINGWKDLKTLADQMLVMNKKASRSTRGQPVTVVASG